MLAPAACVGCDSEAPTLATSSSWRALISFLPCSANVGQRIVAMQWGYERNLIHKNIFLSPPFHVCEPSPARFEASLEVRLSSACFFRVSDMAKLGRA